MRTSIPLAAALALLMLAACERSASLPTDASASIQAATDPWGPEKPPFNLEAVLRSPNGSPGFGLVKFRQPNDANQIVYLDVWVRDLAPTTSYRLQRAVDTIVDGNCTSTGWLTLGAGLTPEAIVTDDRGTGRAELFRNLAAFPVGTRFDIHFRVIEDAGGGVVLESGCYEFVVSQ